MARGGYREGGGRKAGTPNAKTIARLERQAETVGEIKKQGKKLAIDVLDELMNLAVGAAAAIQQAEAAKGNRGAITDPLFWRCIELGGLFAKALAPYQSHRYRAVEVSFAPPVPAGAPPGKVITINDAASVERLYHKRIQQVG